MKFLEYMCKKLPRSCIPDLENIQKTEYSLLWFPMTVTQSRSENLMLFGEHAAILVETGLCLLTMFHVFALSSKIVY